MYTEVESFPYRDYFAKGNPVIHSVVDQLGQESTTRVIVESSKGKLCLFRMTDVVQAALSGTQFKNLTLREILRHGETTYSAVFEVDKLYSAVSSAYKGELGVIYDASNLFRFQYQSDINVSNAEWFRNYYIPEIDARWDPDSHIQHIPLAEKISLGVILQQYVSVPMYYNKPIELPKEYHDPEYEKYIELRDKIELKKSQLSLRGINADALKGGK